MYEADWSSAVFDERSLTRGAGGRAGSGAEWTISIDGKKNKKIESVQERGGWIVCCT